LAIAKTTGLRSNRFFRLLGGNFRDLIKQYDSIPFDGPDALASQSDDVRKHMGQTGECSACKHLRTLDRILSHTAGCTPEPAIGVDKFHCSADYVMRTLATFTIVLCITALGSERSVLAQGIVLPQEEKLLVESVWNDIVGAMPASFPEWDEDDREVIETWKNTVSTIKEVRKKLFEHNDRRFLLRAIVRRFGTDGPRADFAWLIAVGDLGVNFVGGRGMHHSGSIRSARLRDIQLEIAQAQVELFLEQPKLLERYVYMLHWGGWIDGGPRYAMVRRAVIERMKSDEYWWRARDFLVVHMAANGPLNNSEKLAAGNLVPIAQAWSDRGTSCPNPPDISKPFPDWKDPQPIPGADLSGYY